jgi:hypothetical protein
MTISWIVFACVFGGALVGIFLRAVLPEDHLTGESKDVVKVGMGLIATMAAIALGLLTASAKSSYDTLRNELTQISAKIIFLDRVLADYGPEAKGVRVLLSRTVASALDTMWPENRSRPVQLEPAPASERLYDTIQQLSPQNDAQRSLRAQALGISSDLNQMRWLLVEQKGGSIPTAYLVVLIFWLVILFVSFGLFAPSNSTVLATLLLCALSVSGAILLILDVDQPFEGLIQISSAPLRDALVRLGK